MENNISATAKTHRGDDAAGYSQDRGHLPQIDVPVELLKSVECTLEEDEQIFKQLKDNLAGQPTLNKQLILSMMENSRKISETLKPVFQKVNKLLSEIQEKDHEFENFVSSEFLKIIDDREKEATPGIVGGDDLYSVGNLFDARTSEELTSNELQRSETDENPDVFGVDTPILEDKDWEMLNEILTDSTSEEQKTSVGHEEEMDNSVGISLPCVKNPNETLKKEFVRLILESEKNRKIPDFDAEDTCVLIGMEICEKLLNLSPTSKEEKIKEAKLQFPITMAIEDVPFSAEEGPIGDLIKKIDQIFNKIVEIAVDSSKTLEVIKLFELTRILLRKIKQELDSSKL